MIYLDHNATTPLDPAVGAAMALCLGEDAAPVNPSSVHAAGRAARGRFEAARRSIAGALDADPLGLTFTASGTESINMALLGYCRLARRTGAPAGVLTSPLEHAAVRECAATLAQEGHPIAWAEVDGQGRVSPEAIEAYVRAHPEIGMVSLGMVNSELGNVTDVARICSAVKAARPGVMVHTDAVQALGKIPVAFTALGVDLMSVTAHKLHGPVGIGALVHRRGVELAPVLCGGGQERGRRPGTQSVMLAEGFAAAVTAAVTRLDSTHAHVQALRAEVLRAVTAAGGEVLGAPELQVGNTVSAAFPGCDGATLAMALDLEGICVSTGSACSAGVARASSTMRAIGLDEERGRSVIRISLGRANTAEQVAVFDRILSKVVERVRSAGGGAS